ncbi:membrane protein [Dokdonia pacifica]|uniref:DUF418 domain-containing protein n=1 Tax=Dokdonia pacifica TaxID=1627892 RepID=A0A238ZM70_9FLAO|nr:DUF418 domain-containing protein [Dokdonia pacifica]GGG07375.1 membrane protein [Dokdonia pacifica]SNR84467.1 uncharacterized protein SAMN06265376_103353 [Dokdonia pacifica]
MTHPSTEKIAPVSYRIVILDVLRGFALLGIFVVNIEIMNCVFMNQDAFSAQWTSSIDTLAVRLQQLFFYGKFFPIFSLLFGVGISIQLVSLKRKGIPMSFFFRRMGALFLFGVAHILFLWSGDVIHIYAFLGLCTLLLVQLKPKQLIIIALVIFLFPFYGSLFEWITAALGYQPEVYLKSYTPETIETTIREGSYVDGMQLRMQEYKSNLAVLFVSLMPIAFTMFILGLTIGKKGWLQDIPRGIQRIKKPVLWIAVLSNVYRVIFLFFLWETEIWKVPFWRTLFIYGMQISDTLMALFLVWLVVYAFQYAFWKKLLSPLQYAGRMALTNYLLQSFIGLLIFSSVGLQWYQTLSPIQTMGVAMGVFIVQVLLSKLWLSFFQFGPLEWIWRCISYWKVLEIRKKG